MKYYRDTMENYENLVLKPEEVISYMDSIKKKENRQCNSRYECIYDGEMEMLRGL